MNYTSDKKRTAFIAIIIAVMTILLITAIILGFSKTGNRKSSKNSDSSEAAPIVINELRINDLYQGERRIPKFDIPLNEYNNESFLKAASSGKIFYEEAAVGIDVSDYQQDIDWGKVKADEIDFAMIRVGFRGFTEGGLMADKRFVENMTGAIENDIDVGVYFFSQAITEEEAVQEAQYVIDQIKDFNITYPVIYDWEPITNHAENAIPRTRDCTADDLTRFTIAFCEEIKNNGYYPAFYTNKNMGYSMYDLEELKDYDMWYAEYQDIPSFYYHFDMWQYTESGTINGISVPVDLNLSMKPYK